MSDAIEQSTRHQDAKPLKDWRKIIAGSSLPEDVKRLIETVVRKTRLWKRERVSVARELIAHFHDAADAGVSSEEAIKRFGDAKQAARLIRRAKIRNRSWLWHARRFVQRVIGVLILCYIGVGVYYYSGKPTLSVDYVAVLNDRLPKADPSDHAWPIYRDALLSIPGGPDNYPDALPGEENWPQMVEWLRAHRDIVEKLRAGTAKPVFGLAYSFQYGPEDRQLLGPTLLQANLNGWGPLSNNVAIYALPPTNRVRVISALLAYDTHLAAQEGDGERAQRNLVAILDLAAQLRHRDFLITDLVSMGITLQAVNTASRVLIASPEHFDDRFIAEYSHRLSAFRVPGDLITFEGERIVFQQLLQNVFTDDGNGDGRITAGLTSHVYLSQAAADPMNEDVNAAQLTRAAAFAAAPAALFTVASRKQMLERYDQSLSVLESSLDRPFRESRETLEKLWADHNGATSMRYVFADLAFPSFARTFSSTERVLAQVDATVIAFAIERWRREHGRYPESLDALVPVYLPAVPPDRVDGEPVRYLLKEGKPVIYSVGSDGDDDGGRPPVNGQGEERQEWGTLWSDRVIDGDWIIYPPR